MMESTHAQLAANARAQLEHTQEEIEAIAERARGYQTELEDISSQRVQMQVKRDDLVKILAAARTDRERASLEYDVAMNTPAEAEKQRELADCDAVIAALEADILVIDTAYGINDGFLEWSVREKALRGFVQDCYKERDQLLAKRAQLEAIYTQAHEAHGREVFQVAKAEEDALEARVALLRRTLARREQQLATFRAGMAARFADWPQLSNEVAIAYQSAPDDAASLILRAADAYLATLEQELPTLGFDLFRPNVFVGSYNLWFLLGADANEVRLMHFHTHHQTPADRWPVVSPARRRELIQAALAEHTAGTRHTTPSELARIESKLQALAVVSD